MSSPVHTKKNSTGFLSATQRMTRESKLESKIVGVLGRAKNLDKSQAQALLFHRIERVNAYQDLFRRFGSNADSGMRRSEISLEYKGQRFDHRSCGHDLLRL